MKVVLAGNERQYYNWLRENEKDPRDHVYVFDIWSLRGRCFDEIIVVGTFWERKDASEIYDEAQWRMKRGE